MEPVRDLRSTDSHVGFWSITASPGLLDAVASVGPDFVCLDTQHGIDLATLDTSTFTTLAFRGIPGLVRVDGIVASRIGRALDLGAGGVIVPLVETPEQASEAVSACRYAPVGVRSYGVQTMRVEPLSADSVPVCWIQIETAAAIDNIDGIAAVEGVDALYVGPADLGLALTGSAAGNIEEVFDGSHPRSGQMLEAFGRVREACADNGIAAGLHCTTGVAAYWALENGFRITAVGADVPLLAGALAAELGLARDVI